MGVFFRSWSEQVTEPSVVDQDHAKVRTPCPSTLSPASALSALLTTSGSLLNTTHRPLRVFLIATTSKPARADSLFSIEVIMKLCTYDRVTSTNTDRNITLVLLKRLKLSLDQPVFSTTTEKSQQLYLYSNKKETASILY